MFTYGIGVVLISPFDELKHFCDDPPHTVGPDEHEKIDTQPLTPTLSP